MGPIECTLFVPQNGGLGASLACTAASSRVAFPSPTEGSVFCINNLGTDYVYLAFGDSSVVATTSHLAFPPGLSYMAIPNARGGGAPTYFAGITGGAAITVQISAGGLTTVA